MARRRWTALQRKQALFITCTALGLLSEPRRWTRRAWARDRHRHPVSALSVRAVRWCVGGALIRAAADPGLGLQVEDWLQDEAEQFPLPLQLAFLELARTGMGFMRASGMAVEELGDERFVVPLDSGESLPVTAPQLSTILNDSADADQAAMRNLLSASAKRQLEQIRKAQRRANKRSRRPGGSESSDQVPEDRR